MQFTQTQRKKLSKSVIIFFISLLFSCLLVFSLFKKYEQLTISNVSEPLTLLAQNSLQTITNEITQSAQSLQFFVDSGDFNTALRNYENNGISWELDRLSLSYSVFYAQVLENLIIKNSHNDTEIWKLKQNEYTKIETLSKDRVYTYELWTQTNNPHRTFIAITVQNADGELVTELLDLQLIFAKNLSTIEEGEDVYFSLLNQDGVVLMDGTTNEIGINCLSDRKEKFPALNFKGEDTLWHMIQTSNSGYHVFHSYWFDTTNQIPRPAIKIVAFHKSRMGDDKSFIIKVTKDFSIVSEQLAYGSIRLFISSLIVVLILSLFFFNYYTSKKKSEDTKKENKYLGEINKTLQSLHDNEKAMFHQQRLQIIGTMTSGITHELNNMLTPILGYASMLDEELQEEKSPYKEDVHEILLASMKARDIVQQISFLGKQNIETIYHYQNAKDLLLGAKKMMEKLLPSNVKLSVSFLDEDSGFYCNKTQINQVLLNLVLNAVFAIDTKKDGHIDIIYTNSYTEDINWGCIAINDNGKGMDSHIQDQIFTPFFTTKKASDGSGLGLAIAQQIITAHKGSIHVNSKLGKGTTFTIKLPLSEEKNNSRTKEKSAIGALKHDTFTILLVDENAKVRKVLEKGLARYGLNVLSASTNQKALTLLKENKVQALICGDPINGESGINLSIMAHQITPSIPSIILTAFLRKEVIEAKQTGLITTYLVKPVTLEELIDIIIQSIQPQNGVKEQA